MSFNLDKSTGINDPWKKKKNAAIPSFNNNLSAVDNMRLNQSRFKKSIEGNFGEVSMKRSTMKHSTKPLRVRFSLDIESDEERNK